jgi:hypothetical protein
VINCEVKSLTVLCTLCLGLLAIGIAAADDYQAYPTIPTNVPTSNTQLPTPGTTTATTSSGVSATSSVVQASTSTGMLPTSAVVASSASTSSASTITALYSSQAPAASQQNSLLAYDIQTAPPSAVYYSGSYLPWTSFYQVFPASSPALWITSSAGWSWYAVAPLGGWVQELMYVPVTGTMKVYDLYPDGTTRYNSYGFVDQGYKYRWFYANSQGRFLTMLTVSDIPSNYITIDVA